MNDAGWIQKPIWSPPITWTATPTAQLPAWADARRVCVDVECRDDDLSELGPGPRRGGYVCGIAFAIEDGPAHYLPIRHEGGGNLDESVVWAYLRAQAAAFTGEVVFNSAPYDLDYLWQNRVEFARARFHRDVQVAEPLLDELQKTYGLDAIAARRGLPGKDESELKAHARAWGAHPKHGLWRLHAGAVGRYAEQDVRLPLQVLRRQEREIDDQDLRGVYDLESKVTLALVRMTRRGLRVDLDELARVEAWAKQRLADCIDQIHHLTGVRIGSLSNAAELYPALKKRGIAVPTPIHGGTGKATPSITKLWLQQQDDDVARTIIVGREFVKLLGTYVNGWRKHLVGDRIYPSFKQMCSASDDDDEGNDGARFGRIAAKHPNVQAQLKRSKEIKKRWRKVIVADHGMKLYRADISKQEPRLTIHYAELCRLPGAMRAGDAFRANARQDPYTAMLRLVGWADDRYDDIKELYLGRCYGMGGGKLAKKLKLPTIQKYSAQFGDYEGAGPDAQHVLDQFDAGVPYVRALQKLCITSGRAKKYIRTISGRHVRFELDGDGSIMEEHKGLNKLIQGCLPASTRVLTKTGLRPIGDVERGEVWTGASWEHFERLDRGPCELAEIELADGKVLRCDTRHSVLVDLGDRYDFKAFADLREGDLVCQSLAQPLDFGTARLSVADHYWMGYALGNGCTSKGGGHPNALEVAIGDRKGRYAEGDKAGEAITYYRSLGFAPRGPRRQGQTRFVTVAIEHRDFRRLYESWGYPWGAKAHGKRVPTAVWTATLECRRAFLVGLLDADGGVADGCTGAPNLHMCQRPLLEEVQTLLRSLGVESELRQNPSEPWAFRLDLNGSMAASALGYGRVRRASRPQDALVPAHVAAAFLARPMSAPRLLTASQQTVVSRLRHGGTTSVYTLREICRRSNTPEPLMYVGRRLVAKRPLGVMETTYTLSVDHPSHRYDSEGVISKNSAADQTKMALVALDEASYPLQLTVHDEFDYSGDDDRKGWEMGEIVKAQLKLSVPSVVDMEVGESYGSMQPLVAA